jgi:hypothetical protein
MYRYIVPVIKNTNREFENLKVFIKIEFINENKKKLFDSII